MIGGLGREFSGDLGGLAAGIRRLVVWGEMTCGGRLDFLKSSNSKTL